MQVTEEEFFDKYLLVEELSVSENADIFLVLEIEKNKLEVIKVFKKKERGKELHILKELDHENIIKVERIFYLLKKKKEENRNGVDGIEGEENRIQEDTNFEKFEVGVFKFCEKLDVFELLNNYQKEPELVQSLFISMSKAVNYIHEKRIAHCDIKPENFLVSWRDDQLPEVYLTDFEYSVKQMKSKTTDYNIATKYYSSPESFLYQKLKDTSNNEIEEASVPEIDALAADIYSLGISLFVMITGFFPFEDLEQLTDNPHEIYNNLKDHLDNQETLDLIKKMLHPDPTKRIIIKKILDHSYCKLSN